jgi:hypothetical protein
MVTLGIILTAATVTILVAEFFRTRRGPLPAHGWLGLIALGGAEFLMFHGGEPAAAYFNPLAWTAYILLADAATFAIAGHSMLRDEPRGFVKMAALSAVLWLVFEAYNLRLANWGIFVTAALIESFGWFDGESRPLRISKAVETALMATGAALVVIAPLAPRYAAKYLFVAVWLGFIFALDPLNHRLLLPSFEGDLERGYRGRLYSFLLAGWVCGWLWEFWSYWAGAKWIYMFPLFDRWKIFEMPAPGYIVYPVFALECFAMYVTGVWVFSRKIIDE